MEVEPKAKRGRPRKAVAEEVKVEAARSTSEEDTRKRFEAERVVDEVLEASEEAREEAGGDARGAAAAADEAFPSPFAVFRTALSVLRSPFSRGGG